MNYFIKAIAVTLIFLLTLNLCLPGISSADSSFSSPLALDFSEIRDVKGLGGEGGVRGQIALEADVRTAKSEPEILATPEEDIPVEKIEKGGVSWLWILVGVAAVGGIAAAAGGGGGGGSSPSSSGGSSGGTAGTLTVPF